MLIAIVPDISSPYYILIQSYGITSFSSHIIIETGVTALYDDDEVKYHTNHYRRTKASSTALTALVVSWNLGDNDGRGGEFLVEDVLRLIEYAEMRHTSPHIITIALQELRHSIQPHEAIQVIHAAIRQAWPAVSYSLTAQKFST